VTFQKFINKLKSCHPHLASPIPACSGIFERGRKPEYFPSPWWEGNSEKTGTGTFSVIPAKAVIQNFKRLQGHWTPVFTGVTPKREFLHNFRGKGREGGQLAWR
jgi:hypothetical protein